MESLIWCLKFLHITIYNTSLHPRVIDILIFALLVFHTLDLKKQKRLNSGELLSLIFHGDRYFVEHAK